MLRFWILKAGQLIELREKGKMIFKDDMLISEGGFLFEYRRGKVDLVPEIGSELILADKIVLVDEITPSEFEKFEGGFIEVSTLPNWFYNNVGIFKESTTLFDLIKDLPEDIRAYLEPVEVFEGEDIIDLWKKFGIHRRSWQRR